MCIHVMYHVQYVYTPTGLVKDLLVFLFVLRVFSFLGTMNRIKY